MAKLVEQAEQLSPAALNGSAYTSLGSLYYKVSGWPIGFGDNKKAKEYLLKALQISPDGIDSNYFYADYLYDKGQYAEALKALEKAMKAPARADRPLADQGRQQEIQELVMKVRSKM